LEINNSGALGLDSDVLDEGDIDAAEARTFGPVKSA
jgi:hypothetical protein